MFIDTCEGLENDIRKAEEQLVSACKKVKKIIFYGRKGNFKLNSTKVFFLNNEIEWVKNKEFERIATNYDTFCKIIDKILLKHQTKVTPLTIEQLQDPSFEPMEIMSGHALLLFDSQTFSELPKIIKKSPSVVYVIFTQMGPHIPEKPCSSSKRNVS